MLAEFENRKGKCLKNKIESAGILETNISPSKKNIDFMCEY